MLLWYLDRFCDKRDAVLFYNSAGDPDFLAARAYAEELRERLKGSMPAWDKVMEIVQQSHEVVITSTLSVPPKGNKTWYTETRSRMIRALEVAKAKRGQEQRRHSGGTERLAST
jgi:hypothetical protein